MGNRSFLYLLADDDSDAPGEQIAEANNNFPTLWRLLLSGGRPSDPINDQRVFGDAGTDNLCSDAEQGLTRFRALKEFIQRHPLLHTFPVIRVQLESLESHLAQLIAALQGAGNRPVFSANLDELSWMEGSLSPAEFIAQCQRECDQLWADLQEVIQTENFPRLDEVLELTEYGGSFADWNGWSGSFGFGGIEHPYFFLAHEPRTIPFAEFVPEARDEWRDNRLGGGFESFEKKGRWGVRYRTADNRWVTCLAPKWDGIQYATEDTVWLERAGRFGLGRLLESGVEVLLEPQLDSSETFHTDGPHSFAMIEQGDDLGYLRSDGRLFMVPSATQIWPFENGYAAFATEAGQGFVDVEGRVTIAPEYEWVAGFNASGLAPVCRQSKAGLINSRGDAVVPLAYDDVSWNEEFGGFVISTGKLKGLLHADGQPWLVPMDQDFTVLAPGRLLSVCQKERYGIFDWRGKCLIAPQYDSIDLYDDGAGDAGDRPLAELTFVVRKNRLVGMIDGNQQVLVPIEYADLELLEPDYSGWDEPARPQGIVRVARAGSTDGEYPWGVYDLAQRREILPCAHDQVVFMAQDDGRALFLVRNENSEAEKELLGDSRVGILRDDGSTLIPQDYAWIADRYSLADGFGVHLVRKRLREQWGQDLAVQAVTNDDGLYVWLFRDGRAQSHSQYLSDRCAAGDLQAAEMLGIDFRHGTGIQQNAAQARLWLARAAGVPDNALQNPARIPRPDVPSVAGSGGFLSAIGRRLGLRQPMTVSELGRYQAMYELAMMLRYGEGGPEDPEGCRAWLEWAYGHGGGEARNVQEQLGYVLAEGIGGDPDRERGMALYAQAARQQSTMALYNLGVMHQYGQGIEPDPAKAFDYYRRAAQLGDNDAHYRVGALAVEFADGATDDAARTSYLSEALYYLRAAAQPDEGEFVGQACEALGRIYLDQTGAHYDLTQAENWLLKGTRLGNAACMELLISEMYDNPLSPRHDDDQAAFWRQQRGSK